MKKSQLFHTILIAPQATPSPRLRILSIDPQVRVANDTVIHGFPVTRFTVS